MTDYDEKPKRTPENAFRNAPCVMCGEQEYVWGHPGSQGGVYFVPEGTSFGFGQGQGLVARKCMRCGNVQLFIRYGTE
jgi:ribosomal protein S27E